MFIRKANYNDHETVAEMIAFLLAELKGKYVDISRFLSVAKECLSKKTNSFTAYLAYVKNAERCQCIGIITVSKVFAIYAGGNIGVIQEFYVSPNERSKGIGKQLLKCVINQGHQNGWKRIEVGAPSLQQGESPMEFYLREGFEIVGPRLKMDLE